MTEHTEETVRAEARAWLEANWNPNYGLVEWRTKLIESGWGAPHWPKHSKTNTNRKPRSTPPQRP